MRKNQNLKRAQTEKTRKRLKAYGQRTGAAGDFPHKTGRRCPEKAREAEDKAKSEEVKLQTALSQYVRLQADFDNFRRRTKDNEAKAADTYKAETLKSFLPVLDNFELALSHMKKMVPGKPI